MSLARYATIVLAAIALPLGAIVLVWGRQDPHGVRSAAFGAGLAGLNAILAYAIVLWSHGRSTNVFLGAVLGGMVGRMGLLLLAVAVGLGVFDLRRLPLVTALLAYFIAFLIVELTVLNRRAASEGR